MSFETKSDVASISTPPPTRTVGRRRRILVVDDEPAARILAERVFSDAGFEVVTVASGFDCLKEFRNRPRYFDLVLLDLSMPFMDGAETFRRIRAMNGSAVVLLSTGFLGQEQGRVERMLAAGLAGVIRKPHRPDELVAQVNYTIARATIARAGCAVYS
ncbi:MAG TPA: response regulator [Chthoniobacterales bacterium]|nr:response regulator [Chthoniobacterales bacterium]